MGNDIPMPGGQGGGQQAVPGAGGGGQGGDAMTQLMQYLLRGGTHPSMPQVKPEGMGKQIEVQAAGMIPIVGKAVQAAIKQQRDYQINEVSGKVRTLISKWEVALYAANGDKQKATQIYDSDPEVKAIWQDKKFQKGMGKVFGADLLNPEKQNTVFHEGFKKGLQLHEAEKKLKQAHGKMQDAQAKPQQQPPQGQPQGAQGQPQGGGMQQPSDFISKLPQTNEMPQGVKESASLQNEISRTKADLDRAEVAKKDKYQFEITSDGSILAVDKTDPKNVVNVTDRNGKPVIGRTIGKDGPMLVDGVPVGVFRSGKAITPQSPEWTALDAKNLETYKAAYATSEASKNNRIKLSSETRAATYMKTRMYGALTQDGQLTWASADDIRQSPGKYAPASQGVQMMNRSAIFQEIDYTRGALNDEIAKMPDVPLDAKTRAEVALILKDNDPRSAWQSFLQSTAAETVPDKLIPYITTLVAMNESAMSLRSVAGMGAGSDMLRSAIAKMLPGANTPSKQWAQQQMKLLAGEIDALKKGIPHIGADGKPKMSWEQFLDSLKKPTGKTK